MVNKKITSIDDLSAKDIQSIADLALKFKKSNKDIFIFKQLFFYYKFNLFYDLMPWYGTKACKKKKLLSFSWLRNLKNKKYPFWRIDTLFSNLKQMNLEIVEDGGWHFTNIKTPENLEKKFSNFLHHQEFEASGLKLKNIKEMVENKKIIYDLNVDQKDYKWNGTKSLNKVPLSFLPSYLSSMYEKYYNWLEF